MKGFYYFLLTVLSHSIILNHTMKWNHSSYRLDSLCVVESLMLYVQDLSRPSWDFSCIVFHMFGKKPSSSASNLAESWNAGNIFLFLMKYNCKYFVTESIKLELFLYLCKMKRISKFQLLLSIYRLRSISLWCILSLEGCNEPMPKSSGQLWFDLALDESCCLLLTVLRRHHQSYVF